MTTIKAIITRHSVLTFYALTFAISWGGLLLAIGGPGGLPLTAEKEAMAYPTMLAGPGVAGLLLTGLVAGRTGYRDLLARLRRWRVGGRWYAVALLAAPLVFAVVTLAFARLFPAIRLSLLTTEDTASLLLTSVVVALMVAVFEEVGWTGFAIPRLQARYAVVTTGLVVGVVWGLWHFPLFWARDSFAGVLPLAILAAQLFAWLPAYRVLMVWVYDRTGSLLLPVLMHASLLAIQLILMAQVPEALVLLRYILVLAVAMWGLVAAVTVASRGQLVRPPLRPRWREGHHA
jgi:membrane protease YdiL (CAAX protease family)